MDETGQRSRVFALGAWIVVPIIVLFNIWLWEDIAVGILDPLLLSVFSAWSLIITMILAIWLVFKIVPRYKRGQIISIGFIWSVLELLFEITFRTLFRGAQPLDVLFACLFSSRILLSFIVFLAPIVFVRTPIGDPDLFEMPIGQMASIGLLPSSLKIWYYRRRGAIIGEGVSIGPLSIIDAKKIEIGDHVKIGMACMIRCKELRIGKYSSLGMMVIIDTYKVILGEEVTIQEQTYIGGLKTDKSIIEVGDLSMIFAQSVINPTHPIKIGKRVGIGGSNFLFTHGTWQPILDGFPVAFGPITIEDGVWFPWRVFVLPNVHIGKEATIGAGSVVNRDIPARSLAAGVPAKVLRTDGEYIKNYSHEEKCKILNDMMRELVGYLRIEDWDVSEPVVEDYFSMMTFRTPRGPSSERNNQVIFMYDDNPQNWEKVTSWTFVVTLFALDTTKTKEIEEMNSWWFDIESNKWGGTRTPISLVINGWLARYGHWLKYTE
jgi:acetyltransferase-like isoleucine patch superfamily enzyme